MRLVSLLLLGLSSVFAQDLTALKFNGTGIVISSDEAHMTTFRKSLTSTSNGGFTAFTTVTLNENTIRPEEQTLVTYANWNNIQNADSVIRLSLVNVTSTSFQLRFQLLNGTLPSNSSLSSIFTSTVKSFDTSIIDKSFQLMFAFNPEATSSAFYRFGVNGLAAPIYEASSTTSTNPSYVPKQPTWVALKADVGKAELRFGGKVWNAAQGRVESPFYGTLEQVSFHSVLFSQLQSAEVYKSHRNIAQPNVFLANAQIDEAKFAPNGGYYQFQSSNAVLNRNTGVFNFSGAAYSGMTENAAKTPIYALSYGCDANINAQLQYVLLGSTFTCPTPTTQTPVVTDAPTSATTATPTTQAPTNTVTDAPTSPTTSAPTTPVTTDAPTTPVTTEAPTTPVTTQPPTTPVTTEAPTTPVTTEAPTTPVNVTTAPTTPVTTDAPTSTPTPTTPVNVTDAPTSTPAPTTPVNVTDAPSSTPTPTTTVNVTDAPSSTPTPTPTSSTTPTPTNTVTDAPTPTPTTETPTKGPVVDTPSSSSSTGVLSVNGAETTSMPIFGAIMSVIIAALL